MHICIMSVVTKMLAFQFTHDSSYVVHLHQISDRMNTKQYHRLEIVRRNYKLNIL